MTTTLTSSIAEQHQKLIAKYTRVVRNMLKSYIRKEMITEHDVASLSNQAISLIHDIDIVLENTRALNVFHAARLKEIAELLTIFESSLVVTAPRAVNENNILIFRKKTR